MIGRIQRFIFALIGVLLFTCGALGFAAICGVLAVTLCLLIPCVVLLLAGVFLFAPQVIKNALDDSKEVPPSTVRNN